MKTTAPSYDAEFARGYTDGFAAGAVLSDLDRLSPSPLLAYLLLERAAKILEKFPGDLGAKVRDAMDHVCVALPPAARPLWGTSQDPSPSSELPAR